MSKSYYNISLQENAKTLRENATRGEKKLWDEVLKERKFYNYQWNRQFPIDKFIVDFICRKLKIIMKLMAIHITLNILEILKEISY